MATILDGLRSVVTPELPMRTSSLLGESEGGVSHALGAAFPTLLRAMMDRSGDGVAMRQIMDLLNDRAIDPGVAANPTNLLSGNGPGRSPVIDPRARLLELSR